jgi:hypothetical protein
MMYPSSSAYFTLEKKDAKLVAHSGVARLKKYMACCWPNTRGWLTEKPVDGALDTLMLNCFLCMSRLYQEQLSLL